MTVYEYGDRTANNVLLQPVGDHDLPLLENEVSEIRQRTAQPFCLLAIKVENWNYDLSPWPAPAVFGHADFGDGAAALLSDILPLCSDRTRRYFLGGYSLSGLFALWASYQTDVFAGTAAASPSMWFPGFAAYMQTHPLRSSAVYLSLGDREEKTRHPVMSTVGDCIRTAYAYLQSCGVPCTLEWNTGNHFREPDVRTAKSFAWLLEHTIC